MKYCCEECGKMFTKEEDAIACENKHKESALRAKELEKQKEERYKEVQTVYNKYRDLLAKYKEDYEPRFSSPLALDDFFKGII